MVELELLGVRVEVPGNTPVVLLRELDNEGRVLPIFIGSPEATAIALALENVETPRPMTHDLMAAMLVELGAVLEQVVVTELRDKTFYADLIVRLGDEQHTISSRPSDAIALAARTGTPIFAAQDVLDSAAYLAEDEDAEVVLDDVDPDEVVEEFREFLEDLNPEDFEG